LRIGELGLRGIIDELCYFVVNCEVLII